MRTTLNAIHEIQSTPFRFYNANVETLLDSLLDGGHGFSGISANFYPRLHVWLIKNVVTNNIAGRRDKQEQLMIEKVQDFLSLAEATVCVNYPASAKNYLCHLNILTNHYCRTVDQASGKSKGLEPFLQHQEIALRALRRMEETLSNELGVQ